MHSRISFLLYLLLFITPSRPVTKQVIEIEAMTTGTDTGAAWIIGAYHIALEYINNDSSILPDYHFVLQVHNTKGDNAKAIEYAIEIAQPPSLQTQSKDHAITIPIMLGAPTSPVSILTNPILSAFYWAQISSSATSIQLAQNQYDTFFRTAPADDIQAQAIVWICMEFDWNSIIILYIGDSYGIYLASKIQELGTQNGIKVHSISYFASKSSILNAASTIKRIGTFVTIIIPTQRTIGPLFEALKDNGLLQFPYYYIGVDAWFQSQQLQDAAIVNYTKGFIGTVPWEPSALNYTSYERHGYGLVYNLSQSMFTELLDRWKHEIQNNLEFRTMLEFLGLHPEHATTVDVYALYGWDAAIAIARALHEYDKMYDLSRILQEKKSNVSMRLQSILRNESFWFIGATGNVSFHDNGNRRDGLYSLGNIIDNNGNIDYFAVWAQRINVTDDEDTEECEECSNRIIWPDAFIEKDMMPRSEKKLTYETVRTDKAAVVVISTLCVMSMIVVVITIVVQWRWRDNEILRAASWKLNVLTCIGCLLGQFTIMMYGWPENIVYCNMREWLLAISFTLLFMPLFMKTYRVSVIFTGMLIVQSLGDFKLVLGVAMCLVIDLIILIIFTSIDPEHVSLVDGAIRSVHALLDVQEQYVYCIKNVDNTQYDRIFVFVISGWKGLQLLFGLAVALVVSRITLEHIHKFNETNSQIFAILFTGVVFISAAIPIVFGQVRHPTSYYLVLGIGGLLITNVVLAANVMPRLWAVYKGHEKKFKSNQEDVFKDAMKNAYRNRTKKSLLDIIHEAELMQLRHAKRIVKIED
eukprot:93856_1